MVSSILPLAQTLTLAAGQDFDGKRLRREPWRRISADLNEILSAEFTRQFAVAQYGLTLTPGHGAHIGSVPERPAPLRRLTVLLGRRCAVGKTDRTTMLKLVPFDRHTDAANNLIREDSFGLQMAQLK